MAHTCIATKTETVNQIFSSFSFPCSISESLFDTNKTIEVKRSEMKKKSVQYMKNSRLF